MSNELVVSNAGSLFPSAEEIKNLNVLAQTFIDSKLLPKAIDTPAKAIVVMLKGKEAGIPPLQALAHIHVIDGKPSMSAELMLAQLYKHIPGFAHQFLVTTNDECRMKVKRPGSDWQEFSFTMKDAVAAALTGKGPWRAYPAAMLRARCTSGMARSIGPEALAGISYTPEELGADVDGSGNFLGGGNSGDGQQSKVDRLKALNQSKPETKEVIAEVSAEAASPSEAGFAPVNQDPKPSAPMGVIAPKVEPKIAAEPEPEFDPYADYEMQAGHSLKGKKLKDVERDTLKKFLDDTRDHFRNKGQEIKGLALQDVTRIDDFLRISTPVTASAWDQGL